MTGPNTVSIDSVLANGAKNGVNGHTPRTPSLSALSLTEYSANPSPPSEDHQARIRKIVPEEFMLPNGHPDVRSSFHGESAMIYHATSTLISLFFLLIYKYRNIQLRL